MKRPALLTGIISATLVLAAVGYFVWKNNHQPNNDTSSVAGNSLHDLSIPDARELFTKVLWRRPNTDDNILHAQKNNLTKNQNQWFLKIKPSNSLLTHLKTNNAFRLKKSSTIPSFHNTPSWFNWSNEQPEIWTSNSQDMTLVYTPDHIYAHGLITNFQSGADTPLPTPSAIPSTGDYRRLPNASPPKDDPLKDLDL